MVAPWYRRIGDSFLDLFTVVRAFALDTSLCGKTSVSFDDLLLWDSRSPLKRVNVLGEASVQNLVRMQHFDERVSDGWPIATRIKLLCKCVNLVTHSCESRCALNMRLTTYKARGSFERSLSQTLPLDMAN